MREDLSGLASKAESDDEQAIRGLVDRWLAASAEGDHEAVMSMMTDDVVFMVPDQEPFGMEAFKEVAEQMKGVRMEAEREIKEVRVLGDWAYLRVHLKMTLSPRGGGSPVRRSGNTLTLLRKGPDGKWRIARDANLVTTDD